MGMNIEKMKESAARRKKMADELSRDDRAIRKQQVLRRLKKLETALAKSSIRTDRLRAAYTVLSWDYWDMKERNEDAAV